VSPELVSRYLTVSCSSLRSIQDLKIGEETNGEEPDILLLFEIEPPIVQIRWTATRRDALVVGCSRVKRTEA
jgi:hypothetical protein